jgi:hypothetical protein
MIIGEGGTATALGRAIRAAEVYLANCKEPMSRSDAASAVALVLVEAGETLEAAKAAQAKAEDEMDACHTCWTDFIAKIVPTLPMMKDAPLFQQADHIVDIVSGLRGELEASEQHVRVLQQEIQGLLPNTMLPNK